MCVCVFVCVGINVALLLRQKPSQGFFAHLRQQMDCLDLASAAAATAAATAAAADTVRSFSPTDDLHFHTRSDPAAPKRKTPRRAAAVTVSFVCVNDFCCCCCCRRRWLHIKI